MSSASFATLNQLFLTAVEKRPRPDAFRFKAAGRYQDFSSEEALRRVSTLASSLARLGLERGDRLAILSENRLEWALTDYSALGLGAAVVPIYPTLPEPDVEYILRDSGSKGVVVSTPAQLNKVLAVRSRLPELRLVIRMDMDAASPAYGAVQSWVQLTLNERDRATDSVQRFRLAALEVRPEDTASILYTSGTMGTPKGVVLTHSNIASNVQASERLFPLGGHDVGLSFLPLSHIYERTLDYYYFWRGVSIAYAESNEALARNLLEVQPTVLGVVPRVLEKVHEKIMETIRKAPPSRQRLFAWAVKIGRECLPYGLERRGPPLELRVKQAVADALVFAKVRASLGGRVRTLICGSAPLSRELAEFFWAVRVPVYEGYGLTETSPTVAVNYPGCVKLGTVGRAIPGVELKLGEEFIDEAGRAGRELLVRGPNVTPGYYHLEQENREAFVDGWFRTGDLGTIDSDGFLAITGRKKSLFKNAGGKFVSPERLENLFQGHPYVSQILVLGESRKFVSALMVPNFERLEARARAQGLTFRDREELLRSPQIQSFFQQQVDDLTRALPPHERIRQFALLPKEFTIDSGELSPTLKIKRRVVEERYRDLIEELYSRHATQPQGA
jgi:long-chain acyl-CoA synthetase